MWQQLFGNINGYGEANALTRGYYCCIDSYDLTLHIEKRATAVPRINGSISLEEIVIGSGPNNPALGAQDSHGDGSFQAERVADGHDPFPDLNLVRVPQWCPALNIQRFFRFDQSEICLRVPPHHFSFVFFTIIQADGNLFGIGHYVVIGEDIALLGIDYNARAQASLSPLLGHLSKKALKKIIAKKVPKLFMRPELTWSGASLDDCGGRNVDYFICNLVNKFGKGSRCVWVGFYPLLGPNGCLGHWHKQECQHCNS